MKVLHVNDFRSLGGAEVVVERTCELLNARGIATEQFSIEDAPRHRLWPWRYISNPVACRALADVLRRFDPDVVHLHNFYHALSPAILGTLERWKLTLPGQANQRSRRVVMTAHDYSLICPNPLLRMRAGESWQSAEPADRLRTLAILTGRWDHRGRVYSGLRGMQWWWHFRHRDRRAVIDLILCPSRSIMREFAAVGLPVALLPNPIPDPPESIEKPSSRLQFLFAGRVEPEKGLAPFIASLPKNFAGDLTIVGDGSALAECQQTARERGMEENIHFIGRRPHQETRELIASAHVLVLPSLCRENAPNSMLEAIGCRTNLLVSNLGGMREIVEESGIGYCFDPEDGESLRQQLDEISRAFADGSLNEFDPEPFLRNRTAESYMRRLSAVYRGEAPARSERDYAPRAAQQPAGRIDD